ncbi:2'-deoxynucleoside 5'-phosphate n-hydrolase 1 [Anaeramoeba ignava]|uniref:2'-deoxynucleoside 5'-phosphate n-hydrolase 1 n=1 Tax=Anaeramoeba ignava TaxID=1746090 RepID=A0A9Q0LQI5_ANAIG|nr:2'-deoxynucleoside 5'-phosphate n-hydrolase 1 [Anaeramoeba ignava]
MTSYFIAGIMQGSILTSEIHPQEYRDFTKKLILKYDPEAIVYDPFDDFKESNVEIETIQKIFEGNVEKAKNCDIVIAYIPKASMGTAIEIFEAKKNGKIVLVVSELVKNWVVRLYSDQIFPNFDKLENYLKEKAEERNKK